MIGESGEGKEKARGRRKQGRRAKGRAIATFYALLPVACGL